MAAGGLPERRRLPPAAAAPSRKAAPGQPWSHQETIALIDAYGEKRYALKRGQLKAQQWEEVASAVAARCGLLSPAKTSTQCRHKIEKLRKRYRSEHQHPSTPSPWPYFNRMDRMERGAAPASASSGDEDENDNDDDDDEEEKAGGNIRSINGILQEGNWGFSGVPRNPRRDLEAGDEEHGEEEGFNDDGDDGQEEGGGSEAMSQLAAVVWRFGDEMVRMEKRRRETMRVVEREWMKMEAKRAEMVIESQRCLVETIAEAFSAAKKAKKLQDDA